MSSSSWLSHSDRSVTTLADNAIDACKVLAFDPARLRITTNEPFVNKLGRPLMRFQIVEPSGTVQTFSRFNPLVYYCIYGDESFYECLQLSLRSLVEHGKFCGMLGLACDRPMDDLIKYVPEALHHRLIISTASSDRGWFNRYYLDHAQYDAFQPIMYCDVDVVFDANIYDLLIDLVLQDKVCCATENDDAVSHLIDRPPRVWDDRVGNYFGKYLYISDLEFHDSLVSLGNSGIIGFDNTARVQVLNNLVKMTANRQSAKRLASYTDQPILDYVLHKVGIGNFTLLNRYCRLTRSGEGVQPAGCRGMVHFHLPSDAYLKAAAMRAYLRALEQDLE
jgi:hypothetical protein